MNKTAIITGGGRGIGWAITEKLAQDGYDTAVLGSSDPARYSKTIEQLEKYGIKYKYYKCDIGNRESRETTIRAVVRDFGGIHVLVNNAGVAPEKRMDLLEMTEESYDRMVSINAKGTLFFTQAVARQMCTQEIIGSKRGTIINISSCSAEVVSRSRGEYCISKAGISMITKLFAERLAGDGILVHEVRPGIISTDMTSAVKDKYDRLIREGCFPIARWGKPEDVANAVSALAGDGFLYTTGNYIDIDGGYHIKTL